MKKAFIIIFAAILLLNSFGVVSFAEENESWIFIDGENIHRGVNTAVIYRGVSSTGQDIWGFNAVIDSMGRVTDIFKAGESGSEDTAVPEGGAVISASGSKTDWFERYLQKGDTVYYDGYTQRLFLVDEYVGFDPFDVKKELEVTVEGDTYLITNPDVSGNPQYTYNVAVNAEGVVVSRGSQTELPEGGFMLCAATKADMASLIMYAPIGAECVISDGKATLNYEADMLSRTVTLAIDNAKASLERAKTEHRDVDYEGIEAVIVECEKTTVSTYQAAVELLIKLENVSYSCIDTEISELRAAFHKPDETSETLVRATVLNAKAAGLNTLILKVSNGYGTFIPLPEEFGFTQDAKFGGFDLLKAYSEVCADEGIALGLCVDVYYNEYASIAAPEWLSAVNGNDTGLSMKYFSPASPDFKSYFINYIDYIISNYSFDLLMFDYLRYPKFNETCDLGYDTATLQGFSDVSGIPIAEIVEIKTELFNSPHWQKWVEYRMGLVDDMARLLSEKVREKRPDLAVLATAERDNVDFYYMQNTTGWITDKLFDGICQVMFEADSDEKDPLPALGYYDGIVLDKGETLSAYTAKNTYYFMGVESSFNAAYGARQLSDAITDAKTLGADGFVFSNLDEYIAQCYPTALSGGVLRGNAVSPFGDTQSAMRKILEYSETKIKYSVFTAGLCEEETYNAASSKISEALTVLDSEALTYEQAAALESNMAALFATCEAKATIVKDYESLTKLALLAKEEKQEIEAPDESEDISEEPNDDSSVETEPSEEAEESVTEPLGTVDSKPKLNIDVGELLIYGFVGLATVAAVAAVVVSIRRKQKRPAHSHMPKASRVTENEDEEETKL